MKVVKVSPDDLIVDPNLNPRRILFKDEEDEEHFVAEMKRAGPETVTMLEVFEEDKKRYKLHSGYRRLHAAKRLKWKFVPCRVLTYMTDQDRYCRAISTNLHRNNLDGYSLVMSVIKCRDEFKFTQEKISAKTGLSQQYISELLTVSKHNELLKYLKKGGQIARATALARIPNDDLRFGILLKIDDYTVSQLRKIAKDGQFHTPKEPPIESKETPSEDESPKGGSMNAESLSQSREASTEEELKILGYTTHTPNSVLENPIPKSPPGVENGGPSELVSHPNISPDEPQDGGSGELVGGKGEGDASPEAITDPETPEIPKEPPSESNGWKKGWYCLDCGCFLKDGTDGIVKRRNDHTCKDAVVIARRIESMMKDLIETRELIGGKHTTKTSGFLIKKIYGPYDLTDERLKELRRHAHEIKRIAPSVHQAVENLMEYNGRMRG